MGSLRAPKSGSLRAPENETFGVYLGDKGRAGLGDKSGHGAGTGGWFRGQAWWIRTRESNLQGFIWDTASVTRRDYWLISGRKADRLECVPA